MGKKLTIQLALEEFDLYDLFNDVVESYADDLEDPSLSDLYELIQEHDQTFEFFPDGRGDYGPGFEKNLREAIATIIESKEELFFVDDEFENEDVPEIYGDEYEDERARFDFDDAGTQDFYED